MVDIRKVDAEANAGRLLGLFEEHGEDSSHPRAVLAEGEGDLWLAEDGGELAGALLGRQQRSSDGELRGFVENLLVHVRYRRQGIARLLMEGAETHHRIRGLCGMQVALRADNVVARSLYDSMGYHVVAEYTRTRPDASGREQTERRVRM